MVAIKKIYNNNVALADIDGVTKVVTGKGIAYKKKAGDLIDESLIKEQYVLEKSAQFKFYDDIFDNIGHDTLDAIEQVLLYAADALNTTINSTTKLAIIDHLYYAIKRFHAGINMDDTFLGDLKRIYNREYAIAKQCLQMINSRLNIQLNDNECSIITLHFINVTYNSEEGRQAVKEAQIVNDILSIIYNWSKEEIDKESEEYGRFLTHIRYLVRKASKGRKDKKIRNLFLYNHYRSVYKEAYDCAVEIQKYIKAKLNFKLNEDELLYLIVHIVNLTGE